MGNHLHLFDYIWDHPMNHATESVHYRFDDSHSHFCTHYVGNAKTKTECNPNIIRKSILSELLMNKFLDISYFWRRMNIERSPDLASSSSVLLEFRLLDMLRRPPTVGPPSSFLAIGAVLRLISVLDDCEEP